MQIKDHVQAILNVNSEVTDDVLEAAFEASDVREEVFGLSGREFVEAAKKASSGEFSYEVGFSRNPVRNWKYLELSAGGLLECVATIVPDGAADRKPPTRAAQLLASAWLSDCRVVEDRKLAAQAVVSAYSTAGKHVKFFRRLALEWESVFSLVEGAPLPPVWFTKCQIGINDQARIITQSNMAMRFEDLFLEAVSEVKSKWRFFSVYRILEHGYLSEVFRALESKFFQSPRESIMATSAALESELNQFLALAEGAAIKTHFEDFFDEFEKIKKGGNRFAVALDRSIDESKQLKALQGKGKWGKGVLIFYKIRCAIVHAGISSPIFDAYSDGAVCIEGLLPICEEMMLTYLGLSVA